MRRLTTQSGSVYELNEPGTKIRRVEGSHDLRADGEWVRLLEPLPSEDLTGLRLFLVLEPLSDFGPDSWDQELSGATHTTRTTSPVVIDSWHPRTVHAAEVPA